MWGDHGQKLIHGLCRPAMYRDCTPYARVTYIENMPRAILIANPHITQGVLDTTLTLTASPDILGFLFCSFPPS